jgi:hypothetical protein
VVLGGSQPSPRKYRMSIVSPRIRRSVGAKTSKSYVAIQKKLHFDGEDASSGTESNHNPTRFTQERSLSGITEDDHNNNELEFQSPEEAEELVSRMIEVPPSFLIDPHTII